MFRRTTLFTFVTVLLVCGGCKEAPQIATHRVPKSQSGVEDFRNAGPAIGPATSAKAASFATPDGWTRGKSNPMFPSDKFQKSFDGEEVVISVTPLPSSNTWGSNVQRWLGQVSLKKTPDEIEELTSEVEVDGISSKKIRLFDNSEDSLAVIGIMTVKGQTAWFTKLTGKNVAVKAAESEFDQYVKELKIP